MNHFQQPRPGDFVIASGNLEKSATGLEGIVIETPTDTSFLKAAVYSYVFWDDGEFTWERTIHLKPIDRYFGKSVEVTCEPEECEKAKFLIGQHQYEVGVINQTLCFMKVE